MADVVSVAREERLQELVEHFDVSELAPRKTSDFSEEKIPEPIGNYLTLKNSLCEYCEGFTPISLRHTQKVTERNSLGRLPARHRTVQSERPLE